jgi:hypothetical protein
MRLTNLLDAVALHIAHPDTFEIPDDARLDRLQSDDWVKICRNNERFWVQISDCYGETITGTVKNELLCNDDLPVGTPVMFDRRHVYDVVLVHAGE